LDRACGVTPNRTDEEQLQIDARTARYSRRIKGFDKGLKGHFDFDSTASDPVGEIEEIQ
jgi:hypothetical protein